MSFDRTIRSNPMIFHNYVVRKQRCSAPWYIFTRLFHFPRFLVVCTGNGRRHNREIWSKPIVSPASSLLVPNTKMVEANNPNSFHYWNRPAHICSLPLRDGQPTTCMPRRHESTQDRDKTRSDRGISRCHRSPSVPAWLEVSGPASNTVVEQRWSRGGSGSYLVPRCSIAISNIFPHAGWSMYICW